MMYAHYTSMRSIIDFLFVRWFILFSFACSQFVISVCLCLQKAFYCLHRESIAISSCITFFFQKYKKRTHLFLCFKCWFVAISSGKNCRHKLCYETIQTLPLHRSSLFSQKQNGIANEQTHIRWVSAFGLFFRALFSFRISSLC